MASTTALVRRAPEVESYEYAFPAIRGVQASREFFVTMCPLRLIPRLFLFDEEELVPELRAQRTLNKVRVPEIARYILDNPEGYVFSALTASVDGDIRFDPFDETASASRIGRLKISMSARFVLNDGQHRRAAIEMALRDNPDLADETIAVVLFVDGGLERCQQMFADLNRYAIRPAKSIGVLYDHRERMAEIVRLVVLRSQFYRDLVEMESSTLSQRSRRLFTLSAIYTATRALLEGFDDKRFDDLVAEASDFWEVVAELFPEWAVVRDRKATAGEIRRDFIHSHGIVLHALGIVGNDLLHRNYPSNKLKKHLQPLAYLDWSRSNTELWEGRALIGGRVSKSSANVVLTTNALRMAIELPLSPDAQRAEDAFAGARR